MDRRPPGFSLVELLVVTVVAGLMMAAIFQTLVVQQRGYRQQVSVANARQSSRSTVDYLAVELRELSAGDGDLLMATADSLRIRAFRKVGIVCGNSVGSHLTVLETGDPFTADDSDAMVYEEVNDVWTVGTISSVSATTCTTPSGTVSARRLNAPALAMAAVSEGAPVRAFEPMTYGYFTVDGERVFGRRDAGGNLIALVGPLANENGLEFRYFDAGGTELSPPLGVAARAAVSRIEVVVRGMSLGTGSPSQREHVDSLSFQVHLRGD